LTAGPAAADAISSIPNLLSQPGARDLSALLDEKAKRETELREAQKVYTDEVEKVKTLQKQVKFLSSELSANYAGDACGFALTADTFQVTWSEVDSHSTAAYFGPQTQVNDRGACADLSPAVQRSLTAPPKTTIFQPLINWINP